METRLPNPTPSGSALDADSAAIARRFFAALDLLREEGAIRSRSQFYARYGIARRNAEQQRADPSRHILRPAWLAALVTDYDLSPRWLLTGRGDIFTHPAAHHSSRAVSAQKRETDVSNSQHQPLTP